MALVTILYKNWIITYFSIYIIYISMPCLWLPRNLLSKFCSDCDLFDQLQNSDSSEYSHLNEPGGAAFDSNHSYYQRSSNNRFKR